MSAKNGEPRKVGAYRQPPEASKFKKGQSGNPAGRPRKTKTLFEELEGLLAEKIPVMDQHGRRMLSRQTIMLRAFAKKAMEGHLASGSFLLNLRETYRHSDAAALDMSDLSAEERRLLKDYLRRSSGSEDDGG